jgi:hypothetical protein
MSPLILSRTCSQRTRKSPDGFSFYRSLELGASGEKGFHRSNSPLTAGYVADTQRNDSPSLFR